MEAGMPRPTQPAICSNEDNITHPTTTPPQQCIDIRVNETQQQQQQQHSSGPGLGPTPPALHECTTREGPLLLTNLPNGPAAVTLYLWSPQGAGPHCGWRQGTGALVSRPHTTWLLQEPAGTYTWHAPPGSTESKYIHLLREALTGANIQSPGMKPQPGPGPVQTQPYDDKLRQTGTDWPLVSVAVCVIRATVRNAHTVPSPPQQYGQTMVGRYRLDNLE